MYHLISTVVRGKSYTFLPVWGYTVSNRSSKTSTILTTKAGRIMNFVENPYAISLNSYPTVQRRHFSLRLRLYARALVWAHANFYPLVWALSHLRMGLFENAMEATDAFCQIIGYQNQRLLCLPRSIFAATTSRQFKHNGAMFIGGFLPTRHMHAWIIENGQNAYRYDYSWINYKPLAVMS